MGPRPHGGGGGTSFLDRVTTFVQGILPTPPVGQLWNGPDASKAYREGQLHSISGGKPLRLAFRNLSPVPLLLCWVSENGDLHHFYKLPPSSGLLGFSDTTVTEGDHIENSCGGHVFCFAHVPENQIMEAKRLKSLQDLSSIVGGYRPMPKCQADEVHLVTISLLGRTSEEKVLCCTSKKLRGKRRKVSFVPVPSDIVHGNDDDDQGDYEWHVNAQTAQIDPSPFDTSTKVYELCILGGWPVYAEPNWHKGDLTLEKQLADDLQQVAKILPPHAVEYLKENCPVWVNRSLKFGPKVCPIRATYCCYHPSREWLVENGLNPSKHKCIEINDGPCYKNDLDYWGPGGLMVHEFCHAYHHRMLPDGYDNKEILACYQQAMKEKLYDKVKVHGPQGPEAKAYACSNDKEYFAELSTAFLGGLDESIEYNKWFPFNRSQLKAHDPRAYNLLCRVWKVDP